jgi:hypothetical protein
LVAPTRPCIEFALEAKILARQVFTRFKALLMEPSAFAYAERRGNMSYV